MPRPKRSTEIRLDDALNNTYIDSPGPPRKKGRIVEKHSPRHRTRTVTSADTKKPGGYRGAPTTAPNATEPQTFLESIGEQHIDPLPMKGKV